MASQAAAGQPSSDVSVSHNDGDVTPQQQQLSTANDKDKKRRFFGLGKSKDSDKTPQIQTQQSDQEQVTNSASAPYSSVPMPSSTTSTPLDIPRAPRSPPNPHSLNLAASPARSSRRLRSSSPRLHSPDSSSIFERNVQDSTLPDDVAKELAIPAHIQTEDHIPPALEASTIAITDDHLGPDEVKIVTHTAHQPAAEKVVGSVGGVGGSHTPGASDAGLSPVGGLSPIEDQGINIHQSLESSQSLGGAFGTASNPSLAHSGATPAVGGGTADDGGAASTYAGAVDTADVRRLSFISFADVVQSEQLGDTGSAVGRDSVVHLSLSPVSNRSPSPPAVRSPVGGAAGVAGNPPTSGTPSMSALDVTGRGSPSRGPAAPREGGEIVVETMRQALRRTGSGDLRNAATATAASPVDGKAVQDSLAMR